MKFTIQAGTEIETVTPAELDSFFRGYMAELARGPRVRWFSAIAVPSGGAFSINGLDSPEKLGPEEGFAWKVLSVAIGGSGFTKGTDIASLFIGDTSDTRLVASGISRQYLGQSFYLNGGEAMSVTGVATAGGDQVTVSGQVLEVPNQYLQMIF